MSELSITEQLRIVRNQCPDVWEYIGCPGKYGFADYPRRNCDGDEGVTCDQCWDSAIGEDT